jgi:hypothetical protein
MTPVSMRATVDTGHPGALREPPLRQAGASPGGAEDELGRHGVNGIAAR